MAEDHAAGRQHQTYARRQRMIRQCLQASHGFHLLSAGDTPHYFPALEAVGTNKKYLFHSDLLFLFNHSVTTLPRHDLTGFVINMNLAYHTKRYFIGIAGLVNAEIPAIF
jgi:hypothetical protein